MIRGVLLLGAASAATLVAPAAAQSMDHSSMPGMAMPAQSAAQPSTPEPKAAEDPDCPPEHASMGHCTPKQASAPEPAPGTAPAEPSLGTALPAGKGPAPAAPEPDYADRVWGRAAMSAPRAALRREHGGGVFSQVMLDITELQLGEDEGYRWEGEAWFGGDINRLVVKTEGEGSFREGIDHLELQLLYSRAIDPYFNLQAGIRHDIEPNGTSYAAVGVEGLAPYWFEVEAHAFLSTKGDLLARLAASYDQRITQRLILQPRVELNLSAQDVRDSGIGAGLSVARIGLRLRYEIAPDIAP